ncbi:hypothetical protein [Paenibacillus piri]|uniref:Uncharacterized protein n=1 Tax=Paenibacillus piri TaxID=2547395 RepID=A0A4V2ZSV5_9BACL|nr:hypothetical protein [Paenibacillus piri]TDF94674.1 hypothetical protein E1757_22170 [Paenibacillus piri]
MTQIPLPNWMITSIDQRFNELAKIASLLDEVKSMRQSQAEIEVRLKQELAPQFYQLVLDWEDAMNYRSTIEREWLYIAGFKDGLRFFKQLHDFMSANADKATEPK